MSSDPIAALDSDDLERLHRLLHAFVAEAGARCALLLDRSGRAVTTAGDVGHLDVISFAVLAAADFDASDQLAGVLGEREFASLYHRGVNGSMFLSNVAGAAILATIFDGGTTHGTVRVQIRQVVPQLEDVLHEAAARPQERPTLQPGFAQDALGEIDRLFAG